MLSGDDELTLPILALGGDGLISVVSNVVPRLMTELVTQAVALAMFAARASCIMRLLPWHARRVRRVEPHTGEGRARR